MPEQRYDFVVFGATGFTGQFVVDEVARVIEEEGGNLTMAVAGRSMEKLQKVLAESSTRIGKDIEDTAIIIADVSSEKSLADMCKQSKVVLNCVGPYRFYGQQLVKACIENGAHHLDISGEPQYLEKTQLLYSGKAREAGVYIVGACGFDSVPSDMGVAYTAKQFQGDLNSVEFYISLNSGPEGLCGNVATLESALHGFAHQDELKTLRKSLFPSPLPRSNHKLVPKTAGFNKEVDRWCLNFPGSDRSIVNRSIRYNYDVNQQRPFQVAAYIQLDNLFSMVMIILFGFFVGLMAKFSIGRSLIMRYPGFFTAGKFKHGGPSKKQMENGGFKITIVGKGWKEHLADPDAQHESAPDQKIVTSVTGPEAGYVTTPICMVQCALTLLKEVKSDKVSGGVYTTSSIFGGTTLIDRLNKHNIKIETVSPQADL